MPQEDVEGRMSGTGFETRSVGSSVSVVSYEVSSRLEEEHIFPTKHKVECAFREYERNKDSTDWLSWLGLSVGVLVSILTSDTKDIFGASARFWSAVLYAFLILSIIMFGKSAYKRFRVRKKLTFTYFYSGLKERDDYGT